MKTIVLPTSLVEADHLVLHVAPDERVEGAERLVEEHDLGVHGQRAGQTDSLLHAARELVRVAVRVAARGRPGRSSPGPAAWRASLALAADLQPVGDVVDDPAMGQQAEVLEDHA